MGTPNLSIGEDGFYHDSGMPLDIPRVEPHQVMRPNAGGSVDGIEYILEVRTFNKYQYDPVSLNTTEDVLTGATSSAPLLSSGTASWQPEAPRSGHRRLLA
jgi:hypothetical protein